MPRSHPWLAAFFAFGTVMCSLTVFLLCCPGTALDSLWRINPEAYRGFHSLGSAAVLLMVVVGLACGLATIGLWRGTTWGVRLAIVILAINLGGDIFNAIGRHDYRAIVGVPVAGAMIIYLIRSK
jgi:uncharacterized membrane protein (DUF2068 family)